MSVETTYRCDRCKKQVERALDLQSYEIRATGSPSSLMSRGSKIREADFCLDCAARLRLFVRYGQPEPTTPPPSFEELVREIAREVVETEAK